MVGKRGRDGYASYNVANTVTSHQGNGLGVYGVYINTTTSCFNAIETPANSQQVNLHNPISVCITAEGGSKQQITHIINGTGDEVGPSFSTATADSLWVNPTFHERSWMPAEEH